MRRLFLGLVIAGVGLLTACATTDSAAPEPSPSATSTPAPTEAAPAPDVPAELPPLPQVAEANATIVKTAPPPPAGVPCKAGVRACVDLSANQSWLINEAGEVTQGPVPITHGRPGYLTPPGTFQVGWKNIDHRSSQFNNAPMPYSVFFNGGIAFHEGSLSDLSHGCIHLSPSAAKAYFNALEVGDTVQVVV